MQSVIKFSTTTGRNGKLRSTEILIFYHQQPNINECSTFLKRQIEFIVFENSTFQLNFSFRESWHRYFQHSPQTVETTNLNMFLHKLHRLPRRKYKINAEHYGSTMLINSKCRLSACKIIHMMGTLLNSHFTTANLPLPRGKKITDVLMKHVSRSIIHES